MLNETDVGLIFRSEGQKLSTLQYYHHADSNDTASTPGKTITMIYKEIVDRRKNSKIALEGFLNPSNTNMYDEDCFLEPWAKWHKSIPADIMVVGQDWGNVAYYFKNTGKDNDKNPTCINLIELFKVLDIPIGTPNNPEGKYRLHFTNIIPFLRTGKMQGSLEKLIDQNNVNEFADNFIKPLIEIVNPKIIITLGLSSLKSVLSIFARSIPNSSRLRDLVEQGPIELEKNLILFPMFHCGSSGVNRNRSLVDQKSDWFKIRPYLKEILI